MKQYLRRKASAKQKNSVRHSLADISTCIRLHSNAHSRPSKMRFRTTAFRAIPKISSSRETPVNSKVRKTTESVARAYFEGAPASGNYLEIPPIPNGNFAEWEL